MSCGSRRQVAGGTTETSFVAVTQMIENPSWDAVRDGVKDSLAEAGYKEGETLRWEWRSAQGNPATAMQIARKYAWANPDVIVAIAPLSAQSTADATKNIPVIFSAVTDPVSTNLVQNTDRPDSNITGVSDLYPTDRHLALIREILPNAKSLGLIYNAEDKGAESLVTLVKAQASEQEFFDIKEATVFTPDGVIGAARSLVGTVDAIYVPTNNAAISVLESIVQVGRDNDLPVFAGDANAAKRGAIANISFNYYDIGRQTGAMVAKVLKGRRPGDLSVEYINTVQLSINPSSAKAMGVTLPDAVIERADMIVESADL